MDERNVSSVIESLRKQTQVSQMDAAQQQQHWTEVRLRAEGGLIMLGELEKALSETGVAAVEDSRQPSQQ